MAHPYKEAAHKNDPEWVGKLGKYVEKAREEDVKVVVRQYGSDPKVTAQAAYTKTGKGK